MQIISDIKPQAFVGFLTNSEIRDSAYSRKGRKTKKLDFAFEWKSALIPINCKFQQSYFSIYAIVIAYKIIIGKNNLRKDNNHAIFLAVNKYSTRIRYQFIDLDINTFSD